jgi:tRNA A-37 threonylcarbamoyl transferase component Bud32
VFSAPTDEQIWAILAKHGLPADDPVEECPYEGVVNHVRFVGELCLRTLKNPDYAGDILTETLAVPAVRRSGARVPELMVFDPDEDIVEGYVTIYARAPGRPLGSIRNPLDLGSIYRDVGAEVGVWHRGVRFLHDPNERLDLPMLDNAAEALVRNADRMQPELVAWVENLILRLEEAHPRSDGFVHWDLHANNLLISEDRLSAVLDWGDAGWGDPAINFRSFPAAYLPQALDSFGVADYGMIARSIIGVLSYALDEIHYPSNEDFPNFHCGHKCWQSLEELYLLRLDDMWRDWLGDPPPDLDPYIMATP